VKFNHNLTFPAARKLDAQRQSTNCYASVATKSFFSVSTQTDLSLLPVLSSSHSTRPSSVTIKQGSSAHIESLKVPLHIQSLLRYYLLILIHQLLVRKKATLLLKFKNILLENLQNHLRTCAAVKCTVSSIHSVGGQNHALHFRNAGHYHYHFIVILKVVYIA